MVTSQFKTMAFIFTVVLEGSALVKGTHASVLLLLKCFAGVCNISVMAQKHVLGVFTENQMIAFSVFLA